MSTKVFYRSLGKLRQIDVGNDDPKAAQRAVTEHLREVQEHVDGAVLAVMSGEARKPRIDHNDYIISAMTAPQFQ